MNAEIRSLLQEVKSEALGIKAERDRCKAGLEKIIRWSGYEITADRHENGYALTDYERGANDMLATLKQMAEQALA